MRRRLSVRAVLLLGALLAPCACGCVAPRGQSLPDLPLAHVVKRDEFSIYSGEPLAEDSPLIAELEGLRAEVLETLELPAPRRRVVVYLFDDEDRYQAFMTERFPRLPPRRAFFVGSSTELVVYAYHHPQLREDLRHEYTHGVLHATLRNPPLWLDEGLAEYFEVPDDGAGRINPEHLERLTAALKGGWSPNLRRLEKIDDVAEMQSVDYHEAWAWVHAALQGDEGPRRRLLNYVHSFRGSAPPAPFSDVLDVPTAEVERLLSVHLEDLAVRAAEGVVRTSAVSGREPLEAPSPAAVE